MSWHYCIGKETVGGELFYHVIEAYLDGEAIPNGWDYANLLYEEDPDGLIATLELMLRDCQRHPILDLDAPMPDRPGCVHTERALYGDVPDSEHFHRDPDTHSGCEQGASGENARFEQTTVESSSRPAHSPGGQSTVLVSIPLEAQQDMLIDWLLGGGREKMHAFIDEHWHEIAQAMWSRLESGYDMFGSRMYGWDAQTRRRNAIEEVADLGVYLSSGLT